MNLIRLSLILLLGFILLNCTVNFEELEGKGATYFSQGLYGKAIEYIEKNPDYKKKHLVKLCKSYFMIRDYNRFFECVRNLDEAKYDCNNTEFYQMVGDAYLELGKYHLAIQYYERGRDFDTSPPYNSTKSLIIAYIKNNQKKKAIKLFQNIIQQHKDYRMKMLSTISDTTRKHLFDLEDCRSYNNFAAISIALADYDSAYGFLNKECFKKIRNPDHRYYYLIFTVDTEAQFMLNKIYHTQGKLNLAKRGYTKLLEDPIVIERGRLHWMIMFDLGLIYNKQGKSSEALELFLFAIDIIESQRSNVNTELGKIGFLTDKLDVYDEIINIYFKRENYKLAFEYVERCKSRTLIDLLSSKSLFPKQNNVNGKNLNHKIRKIEKAELDIRNPQANLRTINEKKKYLSQAKSELRNEAPELSSLVSVYSAGFEKIASHLSHKQSLIEYYVSGTNLFVFIVYQNNLIAKRLDGDTLGDKIKSARKEICDPTSKRYKLKLHELYQCLFQPIEEDIKSKELIIVPHGLLHYMPYNALFSGKEFLIDRYNISILPSASVLQYLKKPECEVANYRLFAIGNPDLGNSKYDLFFADDEIQKVSAVWANSKVLTKKDATETAVKKMGKHFTHLHFAVHGRYSVENPIEKSGLFFAKDSENDGFLSVGELFSLNLNVDLVTLSACESGMGKILNGDEIVGFTRGFLYAGANAIVSSLWSVDDRATRDLMIAFYNSLPTETNDKALREAQILVKNKYKHPFYWAPFQLIGN